MKKILYVLHSGVTGGTFLTNKDLMKNLEDEFQIYLLGGEKESLRLYEYCNGELKLIKEYVRRIRLNVPIESDEPNNLWSAKDFHNSWLTYLYFKILIDFDIDIIHIRHLINHSFDLPYVAKKLDIPVILSFHDFYFICPFYTLLDENINYCEGKCGNNHENCYVPMDSLEDINSKEIIDVWREEVYKMCLNIDYFVTTSQIVKNLFLEVYSSYNLFYEDNFKIIEHGRDFPKIKKELYEKPSKNKPIKILCPANHLNVMKGSEIIKNIKKEDEQNLLEFHFLGNCQDNIEEFGINHGTFQRDEFYKKVDEIKPSYIGIFSIWPETYCHTLTEAWSCGIPVIGTNIGVIEDRINQCNGGFIIDKNDAKKSYELILNKNKDEINYFNLINNVKNIEFKDTKTMAKEYLEIYNKLLSD